MKIEMLVILVVAGLLGMTRLADDPVQQELTQLSGTYRMVRGEEGGQQIDAQLARAAKLTLTADQHVVVLGDETIRGRHTVNPLENPKSIDATDTAGRFAGKTVKGIYKFEDGVFTVSFAPPGEPRPIDFSTTGKPGRLLHVWKRTP
jgi:uncharacterized protein (TIGR03067 family)